MEALQQYAAEYGIALDEKMLSQFSAYAALLAERNKVMNLTAITDPAEVLVKHFLDSLLLLKAAPLPENGSLIDVGTGAGFPGVPVRIARPDCKLTLLDSLQKRITFLQELTAVLDCDDVTCLHSRAEEGARRPELREQFDIATARAVAKLQVLCEYCLPFVKVGGKFCALKGYEIEAELSQAERAITLLGGKLAAVEKFTLPDGSRRAIVVVEKVKPTGKAYPRNPGKISKSPL